MLLAMTLIIGIFAGTLLFISRSFKKGTGEVLQANYSRKITNLYTKAEVSAHNSRTDCWIIVKDKVYDVTPYVEEHPGGDAILNHAGEDSTEGFYGPQHASRVFDMIDELYIGDLKP